MQTRITSLKTYVKVAKKNPSDIKAIQNVKDEAGIINDALTAMRELNPEEEWAKSGKVFAQTFTDMYKQFSDLAKIIEPLKSLVNNLGTSFENLGFNVNAITDVRKEVAQTAKAIVSMSGVDDATKHLKTTINALKQAKKEASYVTLKFNYDTNDEDLLAAFQKDGYRAKSLSDALNLRMGDLGGEYDEIITSLNGMTEGTTEYTAASAKLVPILKEMLRVDQRFQKINVGQSLFESLDEYDDDTFFSHNSVREAIKEITNAIKTELSNAETELKNITKKWLDDINNVEIQLNLTKESKDAFKSSLDDYVAKLNAGEFGKIKPISIELDFNGSNDILDNQKNKNISKSDIAETKERFIQEEKELNEEISKLEAEFESNSNSLKADKLSEYKTKKLKHRNQEINDTLKKLRANASEYAYLIAHMDEDGIGSLATSSWQKFDAMTKSLGQQQEKILQKTREWRKEMMDNFSFSFKWTPFTSEDEFAEEVRNINMYTNQHPINLVPDTVTLIQDIEDALSDKIFTIQVESDKPLPVSGGAVAGVVPMPYGYIPMGTKPPVIQPLPTQPPIKEKEAPSTDDSDIEDIVKTSKETKNAIESDVREIIEFAKQYKSGRDEIEDNLRNALKGATVTPASSNKEFESYFAALRNGEIQLDEENLKKYGKVDTYIEAVKNLRKKAKSPSKFFDSAVSEILDIANKLENDPSLAEGLSEKLQSILLTAVQKSIVAYDESNETQERNNKKTIKEQTKVRDDALKQYGSEEEKKKRAVSISNVQKKIDELLGSSEVLREYDDLQSEIARLEKSTKASDKKDLIEYQRWAGEYNSAIKDAYKTLVELRKERDRLNQEDPNDPNLKAAREAQEKIRTAERRNYNITRRKKAYDSVMVPFYNSSRTDEDGKTITTEGIVDIIKSGDSAKIFEFIINQLLKDTDVVDRMGPGRRFPDASSTDKMFGGSTQRVITQTIDLVQKALGFTQKSLEESSTRVKQEQLFV